MILFGCLLAFSAAVAPRLVLILAWIFGSRWDTVWQGDFLMPLLGIIFLPYTTIMYLLVWSPAIGGGGNIEGWDWLWIIMGLFLDFMKWSQMFTNRKEAAKQTQKYYPSGAPSTPTGSGTTAAAAVAAPAAAAPAPSAPAAAPAPAPAAEPAPAAPAAADVPAAAGSATDSAELEKLDALRASGALTDDEYEAAKAKL
jgi:hypothetical protein